MRRIQTRTYWIDRLFTSKDRLTLVREAVVQRVRQWFQTSLARQFTAPVFGVSLIVRERELTLSKIGMSRSQYQFWKGSGMVAGLILGLFTYMLTTKTVLSPMILLVPTLGLFGFILAELYVNDKLQQIDYEIHTDFPKFLDLLHLYTASAAYENIGGAMYSVASNMEGTLARQLRELTAVYRFVDLHTFLEKMDERFSTPLAKDLVATLRLADTYGGSISTKIGTLADEAHKDRFQNAKKAGQRASATLLVPLMLFHFPVAIIIFIAPTALALKDVFGW